MKLTNRTHDIMIVYSYSGMDGCWNFWGDLFEQRVDCRLVEKRLFEFVEKFATEEILFFKNRRRTSKKYCFYSKLKRDSERDVERRRLNFKFQKWVSKNRIWRCCLLYSAQHGSA